MEVVLMIPKNNASARSLPAAKDFVRKKNWTADGGVLSKKEALEILRGKGLSIDSQYISFANPSKAKKGTYWANPIAACLLHDWWLILNDEEERVLYVFCVPAKSIKKTDVVLRVRTVNDPVLLISVAIERKGSVFVDTRKKIVHFERYLVKTVRYVTRVNEAK